MKNRFNVYPLWILAQVQRLGSISRAADELDISQPAVSAQLKLLEQEHGKLYHRSARGVILSEAGRELLERAQHIFAELDRIDRLRGGSDALKGRVRLGASTIPGAFLLPSAVASFKDEHPGVEIQMKIASSLAILQMLLDDTLSLAVIGEIYGKVPFKGGGIKSGVAQGPLHWESWGQDHLGLFSHPQSLVQDESLPWEERLQQTALLLREKGSSTRAAAEEMLRSWMPGFQSIVEVGNSEAIREWVRADLGVAVLSALAIARELQAGSLRAVRFAHGTRKRPFFLVRRKDRPLAPAEERLWQQLLGSPPSI